VDFLRELVTDPVGFYHAHQLLVAQCGVNALLAISIWVTLYSGQLTLANVGFMAIGGYTSVILAIHLHTPLVLNVLAGSLLAGVVSLVIGLPVLRLRGVFLAIATVGFGEAIRFGVILNLGITGKGQGLTNPGASPAGGILPVWVSVAVLAWVCWRLTATKVGHAWAAIREDELAAAASGVDTIRLKLLAFAIGAFLAGAAGTVNAHVTTQVSPDSYTFLESILLVAAVVLGGMGTVPGALLGSVALFVLPEKLRAFQDKRLLLFGAALIRPEGLVPSRRRRRELHEESPEGVPGRAGATGAPPGSPVVS
jgi:branched-chain amino acid transport system permease protein